MASHLEITWATTAPRACAAAAKAAAAAAAACLSFSYSSGAPACFALAGSGGGGGGGSGVCCSAAAMSLKKPLMMTMYAWYASARTATTASTTCSAGSTACSCRPIAKAYYYDYYDPVVQAPLPVDDAVSLGQAEELTFTRGQTDRPIKFPLTGPSHFRGGSATRLTTAPPWSARAADTRAVPAPPR